MYTFAGTTGIGAVRVENPMIRNTDEYYETETEYIYCKACGNEFDKDLTMNGYCNECWDDLVESFNTLLSALSHDEEEAVETLDKYNELAKGNRITVTEKERQMLRSIAKVMKSIEKRYTKRTANQMLDDYLYWCW